MTLPVVLSWTTCTCSTTGSAGPHCRCWPTTCRGSRLVMAGRDEPPLRARAAARRGQDVEIGPSDLALHHDEASSLLRNADVPVDEDDVAELHRRTEGWPAGLYLAALYLAGGRRLAGRGGLLRRRRPAGERVLESEFLARISAQHRVFLTRTAVLERMSGPLCEAVLELPGSAATWRSWRGRTCCWCRWTGGGMVPLPSPVPRHAPGRLGPPGARPYPGPAPPRSRLVRGERPARGSAGVLHRSRGRRYGRSLVEQTRRASRPARPGRDRPAVASGGWRTRAGSRDTR